MTASTVNTYRETCTLLEGVLGNMENLLVCVVLENGGRDVLVEPLRQSIRDVQNVYNIADELNIKKQAPGPARGRKGAGGRG